MILDLVEVAESHTGVNLGTAFVNVLQNFGIDDKVRASNIYQRWSLTCAARRRSLASLVTMHRTMIQ